MIYLFLFLLISLVIIYKVKINRKVDLYLISIFSPILIIIVYGLLLSLTRSAYSVGQGIAMLFIPAIISGFVIYFHLNKKYQNNNITVKPKGLITTLFIVFIISVFQIGLNIYIENQIKTMNLNYK